MKTDSEKIAYNRRMIGKKVYVISGGGWFGKVVDVIDGENLKVVGEGINKIVDIWSVRNMED